MFDKLATAMKEAIILSNEVKGLAEEVKQLDGGVRDIDKRLIRIETFVDISQNYDLSRKQLNYQDD